VDGQLLVRTAPGVPWQNGDRLRLSGWLVNAPEQEDFLIASIWPSRVFTSI